MFTLNKSVAVIKGFLAEFVQMKLPGGRGTAGALTPAFNPSNSKPGNQQKKHFMHFISTNNKKNLSAFLMHTPVFEILISTTGGDAKFKQT